MKANPSGRLVRTSGLAFQRPKGVLRGLGGVCFLRQKTGLVFAVVQSKKTTAALRGPSDWARLYLTRLFLKNGMLSTTHNSICLLTQNILQTIAIRTQAAGLAELDSYRISEHTDTMGGAVADFYSLQPQTPTNELVAMSSTYSAAFLPL